MVLTILRYWFGEASVIGGWDDGKRRHLWVVNIPRGQAKQITDGQDWNDDDPQWSPDGARIAFVSDRSRKEYDGSQNKDIWVVPADGGALTKISDHDFLGVTGGSYGGFMTNWIVSHTSRFKAAVALRAHSDFISDEGTRYEPYSRRRPFKRHLV